jgi:LysM repeat protein
MTYSTLASLLLVLFALVAPLAPQPQGNTITPSDLINAINTARVAYGLPALQVDSILMGTAQWTADYMAINDLHGHIGDVRGRVIAAGFGGGNAWATENWASGPLTIDELMSGPWADASHMIPVVGANYTHIGAGVAEYNGRFIYIVHAAYSSGGSYQPPATGANPNPVAPGVSQIIIPVETAIPQPDGSIVHEVKSGQSLWAIAIAYHTHIVDVQQLNGMAAENKTLYVGQKLKIPNVANLIAPTPSDVAEQTAVAEINASGTATLEAQGTATPEAVASGRRPTRTPLPKFTATPPAVAAVVPTAAPSEPSAPGLPPERILMIGLVAAFGLGLALVVTGIAGRKAAH